MARHGSGAARHDQEAAWRGAAVALALALALAVPGWPWREARAQAGGDVFSTTTGTPGDSGPTAGPGEGQGGLPGEPAIDQYGRDAECGGTNRAYYDKMYGTSAVVVSPEEAQRLYNQGEIQRCGACPPDKEICWTKPGAAAGGTGTPPQAPVKLYGGVQQNVVPAPPPGQSLSGGTSYGAPQMVGRKKGTCWVKVHGAAEPVYVWIENRHAAGDVVQGPIEGSKSIVWAQGTVLTGNRFRCTAVRDSRGRQFTVNAVATLTPE
jgi:hypothetical protein